jgi:dihydroorotase
MECDLLVEGKAVLPAGIDNVQIGIADGRIAVIQKHGVHAAHRIAAADCLIFPGFIDLHVHLREPGWEYKEDFATGSQAAIHGGVTTMVDMPNTPQPMVSVAALEDKRRLAAKATVDVHFYGGVTTSNLASLSAMAAYVVGYKVYLAETTGNLRLPLEQLPSALAAIETLRKPVSLHCENQALIDARRRELQGRSEPDLHCDVRPPEAEVQSVRHVIAQLRGGAANICHLSTADGLELVEAARRTGRHIFCEVTPHHLFYTREAMHQRGHFLKVNPPLRTDAHRHALLEGLKRGQIDFLASDHAPHTTDEKQRESGSAPSGVPGLDDYGHIVAWLLVTEGVSPMTVLDLCSGNPARFLGLDDRGRIAVGTRADLTIVDIHHPETVQAEHLYTKCGWSPFDGVTFPGGVRWTVHQGRVLLEDYRLVA